MNKKIRSIIFCVLLAIIIGVVIFLFVRKEERLSDEYEESERQDVIVYEGKSYRYNDHLSNFLFLGIDTTEEVASYETQKDAGQADAIFLVSYDRKNKTMQMISIPRDTMAVITPLGPDGSELGTTVDHINIQYAFGNGREKSCNLMKKAVSQLLYGIPIQGYCSINLDGIPVAVSSLGNMEVVVPDDTLEKAHPEFKKGAHVILTEKNAETFVRYRDKEVAHSAIDRMERQKTFLDSLGKRAKERFEEDKEFITQMYTDLKPYMVTNMGTDDFVKFAQATPVSGEKIINIPGEKVDGEEYDEYHVKEADLYELVLQVFYKEVQAK